ncbi:hypothetical protein QUC31_008705 [Theobroma cacao]
MDLSSSLPEPQRRLRTHHHQQFSYQSTQALYYYQQSQQQQQPYAHNRPSGYAYHQVPPEVVSVNAAPQIADSGGGMAQVGPNPLASAKVVALSQLTQFEGTATAVMQANFGAALLHLGPTLVPTPPVRYVLFGFLDLYLATAMVIKYGLKLCGSCQGGGRRGSRSFRGHGRGYNGHRLPNTGDRGTGRGGGRGGPQCFQKHGASSASQQEPSTENIKSTVEVGPLAALPKETAQTAVPPKASPSTPAVEKAPSSRRPPQGAWCELCRVECTSLEILEQHKNGKRHKKNLQKTEGSKSGLKPRREKQNGKKLAGKPENKGSQHPDSAQEGEEKKAIENLLAESVRSEISVEPKQQINGEKPTVVTVEETPRIDCSDSQRHRMKRKMRGGQGGKCTKTLEASRPKIGPRKRKAVIPLICDLCNVKCDTEEAFDGHLSGKKHTAKLKRFGPVGIEVLYPPNPIGQSMLLPQGNQETVHSPQGSHRAAGAYMPPQIRQAAPAASGLSLQYQQNHDQIAPKNAVILAPEA